MSKKLDRVLLVDDDIEVRELLKDQIFAATRFEVFEATDGVEGVAMVEKCKPDLIYIDLVMPGLTGKDMLIGIKSRNYNGPIIVGVKRGNEPDAIEAFRFGATDYITKPIREAEMMSVVSRALSDVRLRKERDELMSKLKSSNDQLELRLKELTTLSKLGQTLTAMRSLEEMFEEVLKGAVNVTTADHATLILHDPDADQLILRAGKNMTLVMQEKLGSTLKDELAKLVMTSQQPLVVEDEGLKRFKLSREIYATVYAPLVINEKSIGVLTVGNHRKRRGFEERMTQVVKMLADYAAIAIVNARLFAAINQRAQFLEQSLTEQQQQNRQLRNAVYTPLGQMEKELQQLSLVVGIPSAFKEKIEQFQKQTFQMRQALEKALQNEN